MGFPADMTSTNQKCPYSRAWRLYRWVSGLQINRIFFLNYGLINFVFIQSNCLIAVKHNHKQLNSKTHSSLTFIKQLHDQTKSLGIKRSLTSIFGDKGAVNSNLFVRWFAAQGNAKVKCLR